MTTTSERGLLQLADASDDIAVFEEVFYLLNLEIASDPEQDKTEEA